MSKCKCDGNCSNCKCCNGKSQKTSGVNPFPGWSDPSESKDEDEAQNECGNATIIDIKEIKEEDLNGELPPNPWFE